MDNILLYSVNKEHLQSCTHLSTVKAPIKMLQQVKEEKATNYKIAQRQNKKGDKA